MRLVQIDRNSAGGLLIEGLVTRVLASGVLVRENRMNPSFEAELIERFRTGGSAVRAIAGIEVREALLLLEWFAIEDNRYFGLMALDQARVAARYGIVRGSPSLPVSRFSSVGGSGIVAIDEAAGSGGDVPADERIIADLRFMTSSHNEFAGVVAVRAFITTRRARIEHNEIGVGLSFETTDHPELPSTKHALECIDARAVRHNRSGNFSFGFGGDLPLPCDPEFGIDCPPLPPCREVPFVCDWCS